MWDVAIIGAGLSGITCARQLTAAGYNVCILDKSLGLGGRMATRRVHHHLRVDHGLPYWQPMSTGLQALTAELLSAGVVKPWEASTYEIHQRGTITPIAPSPENPKYVAPAGMSAIAKFLTRNFKPHENLLTHRKAVSLSRKDTYWQIECEGGAIVRAERCAIAIPAPQTADLLKTCSVSSDTTPPLSKAVEQSIEQSIDQLKNVTYFPSLTVLAGYHSRYRYDMGELDPNGWMVSDLVGTSTNWIGLDSSKRDQANSSDRDTSGELSRISNDDSAGPVIVIHSKASFAQQYIDSGDLLPAASVLMRANARKLAAWIAQPEWFQIHRWRYAQVSSPYPETTLAIEDTLVCGGDWCVPCDPKTGQSSQPTFQSIDYAYQSGLAMADTLSAL